MADLGQLFRRKSLDEMIDETREEGHQLKKVLGPWNLMALGIGAIIGAGIFATIGTAAAGDAQRPGAGPAEWGRVLIAASVISRHTDPDTMASTVLSEIEITGGEVPDLSVRIRRVIRSVNPDDLDADLEYASTCVCEKLSTQFRAVLLFPARAEWVVARCKDRVSQRHEHESTPVPALA